MAGVASYGAYIPRYRIDRKLVYKAMGWLNPATYMPGEKAVANYDEDSLTMAVAAGTDCVTGIDRSGINCVFFATTTPPFAERQNAEIIATALDAPSEIRTADFTDSLKAGTTAMLSAVDAVKAGSANNVLVCAADYRTGKAGSSQEEIFGDGAAAILIGRDDGIARFEGSFSMSHDFVDHWRSTGEHFDRQWEDRFIRDEGYTKFIVEALTGLAKACSIDSSKIDSVVYPCLYGSDFKKIARVLGLNESQVVEPLLARVGFTGTADPIMHFVIALENAKPGDRIAVVGFGAGADAMLFEVTDMIEKIRVDHRGVSKHLETKRALNSYEKMAAFRNLLPTEKGIRGETVAFTAISELWRSRKQVLGLYGSLCKSCGTPQYPAQHICVNPDCGAVDQMEPYRFSDRVGTLFTYTGDNLAYSPNPPAIYGIIDFEGGGRYWFDFTDVDLEELKVGIPMEMSFRRKYVDEKFGMHGYFWKAVPVVG
jgi:hydroxymethylglutaryl-CoA synthase